MPFAGRIRIVFYADSATKTRATGHTGMGLAFDRNIVEIYADSQRLDPYHELTHIVAGEIGSPPALFNEGLATYMTERLGADALQFLGHPTEKIRAVVCGLAASGALFSLDSLLHFAEIGPPGTHAEVSYPQSASVVNFLIDRRGLPQCRESYRRLRGSSDAAQ